MYRGQRAALGSRAFCSRGLTQRQGRERRGHAERRQQHVGGGALAGSHAVQVVAKVGDGRCQLVHGDLEEGILFLHWRPRALGGQGALHLSTRISAHEQGVTGLLAWRGTVLLVPEGRPA